ncbi:hypothetical protein, conserved [Eimeria necatrix]|uniref:Uncharacterized protein n=1 Tax=Eimeria necatrix TaxID=51315 RepID=U6MQJ5_9EIME|nr:hypothetical protein, conserved [Eimeria necatrix]CDJ63930.1 hypothetical protein, conserved [Eimeria necatrix]
MSFNSSDASKPVDDAWRRWEPTSTEASLGARAVPQEVKGGPTRNNFVPSHTDSLQLAMSDLTEGPGSASQAGDGGLLDVRPSPTMTRRSVSVAIITMVTIGLIAALYRDFRSNYSVHSTPGSPRFRRYLHKRWRGILGAVDEPLPAAETEGTKDPRDWIKTFFASREDPHGSTVDLKDSPLPFLSEAVGAQELRVHLQRTAALLPAAERLASIVDTAEASLLFRELKELVMKAASPQELDQVGHWTAAERKEEQLGAVKRGLRSASSALKQLLDVAEEKAWTISQKVVPLPRLACLPETHITLLWGTGSAGLVSAVKTYLRSLVETAEIEARRAKWAYRELSRHQKGRTEASVETIVGMSNRLEDIYTASALRQNAAHLAALLQHNVFLLCKTAVCGFANNSKRLVETLQRSHEVALSVLQDIVHSKGSLPYVPEDEMEAEQQEVNELLQQNVDTLRALEGSVTIEAVMAASDRLNAIDEHLTSLSRSFQKKAKHVRDLSKHCEDALPRLRAANLENVMAARTQALANANIAELLYEKARKRVDRRAEGVLGKGGGETITSINGVLSQQLLERLSAEKRRAADGAAAANSFVDGAQFAEDFTSIFDLVDISDAAAAKAYKAAAQSTLAFAEFTTLYSLEIHLRESIDLWADASAHILHSGPSVRRRYEDLKAQFADWQFAAKEARDISSIATAAAEMRSIVHHLEQLVDMETAIL